MQALNPEKIGTQSLENAHILLTISDYPHSISQ
ncbi:MAG: hypothetical protein RL060_747 [Bacteroidota bacterium]